MDERTNAADGHPENIMPSQTQSGGECMKKLDNKPVIQKCKAIQMNIENSHCVLGILSFKISSKSATLGSKLIN